VKLKADHVGVGLAIVGLFLNANMIIWCWPCYMMSNVFMAFHTEERISISLSFSCLFYFEYLWMVSMGYRINGKSK